jgi:hypothetical protein
MVYHGCGIAHISPSQKAKLKRGEPVRMKLGSAHNIPMTEHQIKKLASAHKKGSAHTVHLDPYQIDHLHGSGFFDSIKSAFSHPITKSIVKAVRPVATDMARGALSSFGPMGQLVGNTALNLANEQAEAHGYGLKKAKRTRKYVHHDKRLVEPVERGRKLKGAGWGMDLLKAGSKALRPVATNFLQEKLANRGGILGTLGNVGLNLANDVAEKHGFGIHKKKRGRPRKHHGGALIAAGY